MEPGAPLYQREAVYLADEVDALLQQRQEEMVKRMAAWNTLIDGYDESIAQLQHQLAAMQGPGTPYARWQRMLEALERRFPDPQPSASSCPAEAHYLEAIDGIIAQLAASEQTAYERAWKIDTLKDQLAASQSRCAQLVDALGEIAPFAGSWLEETYGDTYTTHSSWIKVRQALTSTERPPA
jgi:hypothetical protein